MNKWISKKQVSEMLGVCTKTIERRVMSDPEFPKPWKRKKTVRFRKELIEEYMRYLEIKRQQDLTYDDQF